MKSHFPRILISSAAELFSLVLVFGGGMQVVAHPTAAAAPTFPPRVTIPPMATVPPMMTAPPQASFPSVEISPPSVLTTQAPVETTTLAPVETTTLQPVEKDLPPVETTTSSAVDSPNRAAATAAATTASLSISGASVSEGNFGSKYLKFTVAVSGTHSRITANYATANGSATAGSDYTAASGQVVINSWQSRASISVSVRADRTYEPDETFTVTLSNPVNATIAVGTATGTITNDDPAPTTTTTRTTTTVPPTTTTVPATTTTTTTPPTTTTTAETGNLYLWNDGYGSGKVVGPGFECVPNMQSPCAVLPVGTVVTLNAVPDPGSKFSVWTSGCDGGYWQNNPCTRTINAGYNAVYPLFCPADNPDGTPADCQSYQGD